MMRGLRGDICQKITWQNQGSGGAFSDIVLALFYALNGIRAAILRPRRGCPATAQVHLGRHPGNARRDDSVPTRQCQFLRIVPYRDNASLPVNIAIAFIAGISVAIDTDKAPTGMR